MHMKALLLSSFLLFLLLFGCARNIAQDRVIGSYVLKESNAADELRLAPNGTYQHVSKGIDGHESTASDVWRFETVDGEPTVVLKNFKCTANGANSPGQGFFLMRVTSSWGRCRLWTDADKQEVYFEQTEEGLKP